MENDFEVEISGNNLRVQKGDQVISMDIGYVSEDRREGHGNKIFMSHPLDELDNRVGHIDMVNWKEDKQVKHYYQSKPPVDAEETCFIRTSKVQLSDESEMDENEKIWITEEEFEEILDEIRSEFSENPEVEFSVRSRD